MTDHMHDDAQPTHTLLAAARALVHEIAESGTHQRWKRLANALETEEERALAAVAQLEQEPVGWLHTMHMELGQLQRRFTFTEPQPFGRPGEHYSSEYKITSVPVYAAQPPAAPGETPDFETALRRALDDLTVEDGKCNWAEVANILPRMRGELRAYTPPQRSSAGSAELRFGYTNYRGETSCRRVRPISIRYGTSEYHRAADWLMLAFDFDKNAEREFSMHDMLVVEPDGPIPLAVALNEPQPMSTREAALEAAARAFIEKVDRGHARSLKSYSAFLAALALPRPEHS